MAEAYAVAWDSDASADLLVIARFIALDSPSAARRAVARLTNSAGALRPHPHPGRRVAELVNSAEFGDLARSLDVRETIVRPWRLTYVIEARRVRIVAVVDSRRDMVAWLEPHIERVAGRGDDDR